MERTQYKDIPTGRYHEARIVDELPTVEKLDYTCGHDQIIRCDHLICASDPITRDYGWYEFYRVTEFWGSQCDDPDEFDSNSETYDIAVWQESSPLTEEEREEEEE